MHSSRHYIYLNNMIHNFMKRTTKFLTPQKFSIISTKAIWTFVLMRMKYVDTLCRIQIGQFSDEESLKSHSNYFSFEFSCNNQHQYKTRRNLYHSIKMRENNIKNNEMNFFNVIFSIFTEWYKFHISLFWCRSQIQKKSSCYGSLNYLVQPTYLPT